MTKNTVDTTASAKFIKDFVKSLSAHNIHSCEDCPHRNLADCMFTIATKGCPFVGGKTWYSNEKLGGEKIPLPEFTVSAEEADKLDPISDRIEDDLGQEIVQDLKDDQILDFEDLEIKRKKGLYDVKIYFYLDELGNKIFYYRATKQHK